jgi:hypothetical protein
MREELSGPELHHWQSFVVGKAEQAQQAGKWMLGKRFPKPCMGWLGNREWTSMMLRLAFDDARI